LWAHRVSQNCDRSSDRPVVAGLTTGPPRDIVAKPYATTISATAQREHTLNKPELLKWLPSRFEVSLAAVLVALLSAVLVSAAMLVPRLHPF
jgi:hypothetical protein